MDVRSWYLIGFLGLVIALLIFGECFAVDFSMSGELHSGDAPQKSATSHDDARVISHHSTEHTKSANEL